MQWKLDFRGYISLYIHISQENFWKMLKILVLWIFRIYYEFLWKFRLFFSKFFNIFWGHFIRYSLFFGIVLILYIGNIQTPKPNFFTIGGSYNLFFQYTNFLFFRAFLRTNISKTFYNKEEVAIRVFLIDKIVKEYILMRFSLISRQNCTCEPPPLNFYLPISPSTFAHLPSNPNPHLN